MLHKPCLHAGVESVENAMKRAVSWQITCFYGSHPANYHWDAGESFQKCSNDDLLYILLKLYSLARFDGLPLTVTYQHQFSFTTLTLFSVAACMFPFYSFRRETSLSPFISLNSPSITSWINQMASLRVWIWNRQRKAQLEVVGSVLFALYPAAGTATCLTTPARVWEAMESGSLGDTENSNLLNF